ncbi:MAG: site-2 protease family protein [Firmicutes bacterium]|nr:site-2 protease family protein [Bacillota bacterium]
MMKRRLDLTPGFPAFLAAVWYFDSCGIFWPFLAAMTVHELAHAAVLLLLGGRIESVRLSFAQVELRTGLLSDRTELWSTAAGPGINLLCGWLFRRWMPAFAAVSLLLALFNLLPVWPLDGGRLLRTLLRMRWGAAGVDASQTLGLLFGLGLLAGAVFAARRWDAGVWPAVTAGALLVRLLRSQYAEKAVAFPAAEQ